VAPDLLLMLAGVVPVSVCLPWATADWATATAAPVRALRSSPSRRRDP